MREEFANKHPQLVQRVLKVYEQGRRWALANPDQVAKALAEAAKIPENVAQKQLKERTELTHSAIGKPQRDSILAAGIALQKAGVIDAKVNVQQVLNDLIDERFNATLSN